MALENHDCYTDVALKEIPMCIAGWCSQEHGMRIATRITALLHFGIVAITVLCGCAASPPEQGDLRANPAKAVWTTPLRVEVVEDLCQKLELCSTDWRCQPGAVVYASDFTPEFEALGDSLETLKDIDVLFSGYMVKCQRTWSFRGAYYQCYYDLRGDQTYMFAVACKRDGTVLDIEAFTARPD